MKGFVGFFVRFVNENLNEKKISGTIVLECMAVLENIENKIDN